MKSIKGDLLKLAKDGKFDVICHGANCLQIMGAGIARQIRDKYPEAYAADKKTKIADDKKLGTFSKAKTKEGFLVYNFYTQYHLGRCATLSAIKSCFEKLKQEITKETRIGIPAIGCGLGGLNWKDVEKLIDEVMVGYDITFVEYSR